MQGPGAHRVPEGGLGEEPRAVVRVFDVRDRDGRVRDPVVDDGIDGDGDAVLGQHLLGGHVVGARAQIHPRVRVDAGQDEEDACNDVSNNQRLFKVPKFGNFQ